MNILPKKSWHVRNKDNVDKVRKDEENARLEAKEQSRRAALAEQEARTNYLRDKARNRTLESSDDLKNLLRETGSGTSLASVSNTTKNVGISSSLKNEDHEREKKQEQEKYEKKIGLLTYLGQSAAETMDDCAKPWYFKVPERCKRDHSSDDDETTAKELKRKALLDPIKAMKSQVQQKKLADSHSKKYKKRKQKRRDHSVEREVIPHDNDKLAKLREERLKREKKEKDRTKALLNGGQTVQVQESKGRYNSQFNPHLARSKI